jgi:hypothetical protein
LLCIILLPACWLREPSRVTILISALSCLCRCLRSDAHALLKHQAGEVDGELESARQQLNQAQDELAAAQVGTCVGLNSEKLPAGWLQPGSVNAESLRAFPAPARAFLSAKVVLPLGT